MNWATEDAKSRAGQFLSARAVLSSYGKAQVGIWGDHKSTRSPANRAIKPRLYLIPDRSGDVWIQCRPADVRTSAIADALSRFNPIALVTFDPAGFSLALDSALHDWQAVLQNQLRAFEGIPSAAKSWPEIEPLSTNLVSPATVTRIREGLKGLSDEEALFRPELERRVTEKNIPDEDIREFVKTQLDFTFSYIADMAGFVNVHRLEISDENGFKNFVDLSLQQRIEVRLRDFPSFSTQLWADLISYLAYGGRYEGAWGCLTLSGGRLFLDVSDRAGPLPEVGKRPTVLE